MNNDDTTKDVNSNAYKITNNTFRYSGKGELNNIIKDLSARGGGTIELLVSIDRSMPIVFQDNIKLFGGKNITIKAIRPMKCLIDFGSTSNTLLHGGMLVDCNNRCRYGLYGESNKSTELSGIKIINWRVAIRFQSGILAPVKNLVIGNKLNPLRIGRPATSKVGQGVQITHRPSVCGDFVEGVKIDGLIYTDAVRGSHSSTNKQTGDLLAMQGVDDFTIRNFYAENSGEVSLSLSYGTSNGSIGNTTIKNGDSNGLYIAGAHYMIEVSSNDGVVTGDAVTTPLGAGGVVEFVITGRIIIKNVTRLKIQQGNTVNYSRGGSATVIKSHYSKNIILQPSIEVDNIGLDKDRTGKKYAGINIQHASSVLAGGRIINSPVGLKVNSSDITIGNSLDVSQNKISIISVGQSTIKKISSRI